MSIVDSVSLNIHSADEMTGCGRSLAKTLYKTPLTIVFRGELGAGKTTFIKGFAEALGVTDTVISPSFALEQRYGSILSHIDLYRLTPAQATEFMRTTDEFDGIRVIEWGGRDTTLSSDILITIDEKDEHTRKVTCTFSDVHIPTDKMTEAWIREVKLPKHIVKHMDAVTSVADQMSDLLLSQGRIVRKKAVHASAKSHDLLRYVDFKSWMGDALYTPTDDERVQWSHIKEKYGVPHEQAVTRFLQEKGYGDIGAMISKHRGSCDDPRGAVRAWTIEQMIVAYADKRMLFETPVTLDERFDDLCKRYGNSTENDERKAWRKTMKEVEQALFRGRATF